MLPALTALLKLQDVEARAEDARRRIADAPTRIGALDAQLAAATGALDAARAALADNQTARREREKEAAVAQQRVSKYKDQLMEAKDNRQFHALQHEIATFSAELQTIEEQVLVRMLEADELGAAVKAAEGRLAADTKAVAAQKAAIGAEVVELTAALNDLRTARAAVVAELPAALVRQFETVFKARRGTALAKAVDGLCEACRVRIRPHLYNQVRSGSEIIQCESCQRILYFVPPPPKADGEPAPPETPAGT
ncbi:MAG: zinc ribbon domain-containing protein [Vicinamibacterales bacterium]